MLLPENVTEKNNGFTKPPNMPHLDIVQKADCKGDKTNSRTGTIHSPQETAGAPEMQAGLPVHHQLSEFTQTHSRPSSR